MAWLCVTSYHAGRVYAQLWCACAIIYLAFLQASWLVKADEKMSPNDREEVTPVSVNLQTERKSERIPLSDPIHPKVVKSTPESNKSSKPGSANPRKEPGSSVRTTNIVPKPRHRVSGLRWSQQFAKRQQASGSPLGTPPPVLLRQRQARLPQDAPAPLPKAPPSLSQEVHSYATRRNTIGDRGDVNFWMSLADIHNDVAAQKTKTKLTSSSTKPGPLSVDPSATSLVPLVSSVAGSTTGNAGAAAPAAPPPDSSTDSSVMRKHRGRPPKKLGVMRPAQPSLLAAPEPPPSGSSTGVCAAKHKRPGRPPKEKIEMVRLGITPLLAGDYAQPSASDVQSSRIDLPSATERCHGRRVRRLAVQPAASAAQRPLTDVQSFEERHRKRPSETYWETSVASPGATRPTSKPVGAEVPSVKKQSGLMLGRSRVVQSSDEMSNQTAVPSDGSLAKPPVAFVSQTKRGRPFKKFRAAKLASEGREQCSLAEPPVAVVSQTKRGRPFKKFRAAKPSEGREQCSLAEPPVAVVSQTKRGRPFKKFRAAKLASEGREQCSLAKPPVAVVSQTKRGRPFKKFRAAKLASECREQSASSAVQTDDLQSSGTKAKSADLAAPAAGLVPSSAGSVPPVFSKLPENPPKECDISQPIDKERGQSTSSADIEEERLQRRLRRVVARATILNDIAATPAQPASPSTLPAITPVPAASTGDRRDDGPDPTLAEAIIP